MTAGNPPRDAVAGAVRRDRIVIGVCVALIVILAWAYLVSVAKRMSSSGAMTGSMAGMSMPMSTSWRLGDFAFTLTMWSVMMVGMMAPSATPMLLLFARSRAQRGAGGVPSVVLLFGLGYFVVWVGFSALATLAQWSLHTAALLSPAMVVASPRLAGAVLIGAGLYQWSPAKNTCLHHCQSPVGFLMSHWRDGARGALQMGLHHGFYCLGCCWALMVVLFAVGVMNLAWVGLLTVFVLLERLVRWGSWVARLGGGVLVTLGVLMLAGIPR